MPAKIATVRLAVTVRIRVTNSTAAPAGVSMAGAPGSEGPSAFFSGAGRKLGGVICEAAGGEAAV